jgi:hypothetical protein
VCAGETEPQGLGLQEAVQSTPALVGSLLTVAVKCALVPMSTVEDGGLTDNVTPITVIVTPLLTLEFITVEAVTVTVRSLGCGTFGAV